MCNRFSTKRIVQLLSFRKHHASNFLDLDDRVSKMGRIVSLQGHQFVDAFRAALPAMTMNDSVMIAQFVIVEGTTHKQDSVILMTVRLL